MEEARTVNVFFSIIFAFFVGLASMSMSLFKAQQNPSAKPTLAADLSIIYNSEEWRSMLWLAILCILVYTVGCVLLFGTRIYFAPAWFADERFQKRWKFLFIKFRVLLNMATACLDDPVAQLYWIMVTCLAHFMTAAIVFP